MDVESIKAVNKTKEYFKNTAKVKNICMIKLNKNQGEFILL